MRLRNFSLLSERATAMDNLNKNKTADLLNESARTIDNYEVASFFADYPSDHFVILITRVSGIFLRNSDFLLILLTKSLDKDLWSFLCLEHLEFVWQT